MRRLRDYFKRRAGDLLIAAGGLSAFAGNRSPVTAALFLVGGAVLLARLGRTANTKRRERRRVLDAFGNPLP